jgi:hypothetical protein
MFKAPCTSKGRIEVLLSEHKVQGTFLDQRGKVSILWIYYRVTSEATQYADTEVEELLTMLRETEHLEEQGDILQYLVDTQGLDFNTGL